MHKALREVLGSHVQQKGSLVDAEQDALRLRAQRAAGGRRNPPVEDLVNQEILANLATDARVMPIEEAQRSGAMMLFGEKYGDQVRVLTIGTSKELCGGVHVKRSGDIGLFKIVAETGVAAGIRRVEAVTGDVALALVQQQQALLADAAAACRTPIPELPARLAQVFDNVRSLERENARLKAKLASTQGDDLLAQAVEVRGAKVLAAVMEGADVNTLRATIDKLRDKLKSAAVVLASTTRRQGDADRRRHRRPDRQGQGGRTREHGRPPGRRQGRWASRHGAGRRHDPAKLPAALARCAAWVEQRL
jgi:alanyl-tRNA synthetase